MDKPQMTGAEHQPVREAPREEVSPNRSTTFFNMDQRKNEFLATLAHELRNPLAPIKNGLQLLTFMKLGTEADAVCSMIARQVAQIVHLVDDLLDISRISCGKVLLDKQICLFSSTIEAAVEQASVLIAENGMTLEVSNRCPTAYVCGDPCRLTQVFCNLLNNSAKYGRAGGKIAIGIEVRDDSIFVRVQDDGIGISADRLDEIFRMYAQIESAQGRGSAGLGIGLALVRTLVELHGGRVTAESGGPNCGSTFTVRLPLAQGILQLHPTVKAATCPVPRPLRIIIVDDQRAMRTVMKRLLEKLGHEVQVADNGRHALTILESFTPDMLFSDITMPVMGGYELAGKIRKIATLDNVRLVALTGFGQSTDRDMAFEAGFDRHLTKPVAFEQLRTLFEELAGDRLPS